MSACPRCNSQPSDAEVVCRDCGVSVIDVLRAEVERLKADKEKLRQTALRMLAAIASTTDAERQRNAIGLVRACLLTGLMPEDEWPNEIVRRILAGESQG